MNKKVGISLIIICVLMLSIGCSAQDKPEKVVSEYINAMKGFDFEIMSSKINPKDKESREEVSSLYEEGEDSIEKYFLDYVKSNAKRISYEIKESKIDGDNAVVSVNFKYVDGGPLFRATFGEYMKGIFTLAFTNKDMTDEENSEIFISTMEEQSKLVKESFVEKILDVKCIKVDNQWYIDNPSDEILDVVMSNMISVTEDIDDSFNLSEDESSDESSTVVEQIEADNKNIIEKNVGDEITLATIKIKVTKVEEAQKLTSDYGSPISAKEEAKFVLLSMDITNITKAGITTPDGILLIDDQEREFNTYSDSMFAIDDNLDYRDLSPSIKETGRFIYEVPEDSSSYHIIIGKAGTDDVYKIILK